MSWDRVLRVHAVLSTVALALLGAAVASGWTPKREFEQLSVRQLNVLDADGRVRVQVAGDFGPRRAGLGGVLFHHADGTEAGGLVYYGEKLEDGTVKAGGLLTFDQYGEDQIMTLEYAQAGEKKRNGLRFVDRPNEMSEAMMDFYRAFAAAQTDEERARVRAEILPTIPAEEMPQQRLFVGRDLEGNALLKLADARGRPRIRLEVEPNGGARMLFLDEQGEIVKSLEP